MSYKYSESYSFRSFSPEFSWLMFIIKLTICNVLFSRNLEDSSLRIYSVVFQFLLLLPRKSSPNNMSSISTLTFLFGYTSDLFSSDILEFPYERFLFNLTGIFLYFLNLRIHLFQVWKIPNHYLFYTIFFQFSLTWTSIRNMMHSLIFSFW